MDEPIRRTVVVDAPPEAVWDAITRPDELAAWFGAEAEVDLRVGGAVRFRWPDGTERRGLVIDVDPPNRLTFRWRELRSSGSGLTAAAATVVAFALERVNGHTRVTVAESPGVLPDEGQPDDVQREAETSLAMAEHA